MPSVSGMIRTMAAVPRVHLANPKKNAEEISALLDIAEENHVQLCVFPELCLTGATCGDLFMQPALLRAAADALSALAHQERKTIFVVGLPMDIGGRLYNCVAVVWGREVLIIPKARISNHSCFCEPECLSSGSMSPDSATFNINPFDYMVAPGNPLINCGDFLLGLEIDFHSSQPSSVELAMRGATIIAGTGAQSEQMGSHSAKQKLLSAHSERLICGYVHANAGYGESTTDMVFSGHAGIYENGELLAENKRFARESSYATAVSYAPLI